MCVMKADMIVFSATNNREFVKSGNNLHRRAIRGGRGRGGEEEKRRGEGDYLCIVSLRLSLLECENPIS